MEDPTILQEFLIESADNLAKLDQEMVRLEQEPENQALLGSVFRTVHTIKGTCGFLGFNRLGGVTHVTEDILSQLRDGERRLDSGLTSLILEAVDAIKRILASIEQREDEGEVFELDLLARLEAARNPEAGVEAAPPLPVAAGRPAAPEAVRTESSAVADNNLRVDVGLLDRLMNLVGELVLTRNQIVQYNAAREDSALNAISQRLNLITSELQEGVMKTRMQPIRVVWSKLPRIVRDLAASLNKEIALEMDGAGTELDRTIIEAIKDPLTHIVRNSCDHGIEAAQGRAQAGKPRQGRLSLRAFHEGGQVNIEIADDGAGIDPERVKAKAMEKRLISPEQAQRLSNRDAVNLVFLPGFSTAEAVSSISGRGVGMDVVRTHIERIGGTVDVSSKPGQGTVVRVRIPLTLAIIPGLVVEAGGERFVIPQINLHELIQLQGEAAEKGLEYIQSAAVIRRRNLLLPVADLCELLKLEPKRRGQEKSIVILQADEHRFGLIVDSICDSQEIVVKPLGQQLKGLNFYAGATIMGDGRIALILDIVGLGARSGLVQPAGTQSLSAATNESANAAEARLSLLLIRAGCFQRVAIPLARVARLEKIPAANVELAAGRRVVQYRDRMLPLISLAGMLGGGTSGDEEEMQVVVCRSAGTEFGLVVDEIADIVEDAVTNAGASDRPGLLGSAVVGGRVTDFLDLDAVAQWAAPGLPEGLERLNAMVSEGPAEYVPEGAWR